MERITIDNFAGIKAIDLELKLFNVLIGPQGAGKSVTAKLIYFFKKVFFDISNLDLSSESKREFDKKQKEKFVNFFPKESWPKGDFKISYYLDKTFLSIEGKENKIFFDYSENLKKTIIKIRKIHQEAQRDTVENSFITRFEKRRRLRNEARHCLISDTSSLSGYEQVFIPAGRSFFANLQKSIFSFLSENSSLDPFLIEFGAFYEDMKFLFREKQEKEVLESASKILNGSYLREKDVDYLLHDDNRKVNLTNASSGQQETLPLIIILQALGFVRITGNGTTVYIEEPEAHLFPVAQKSIMHLLARIFNSRKEGFQIIITTHSPYILSSLNNLLQAGRLNNLYPDKAKLVSKIIPSVQQIDPDQLAAYSLKNGISESIIDRDSGLISQTLLDDISGDISTEFGKLLDIEFDDEKL